MSKIQELQDYLDATGFRLGGFTRGNGNPTAEEVAASILASLKDLEERAKRGPPHECPDWDGLSIFPGDPEMEGCTCNLSELLKEPTP